MKYYTKGKDIYLDVRDKGKLIQTVLVCTASEQFGEEGAKSIAHMLQLYHDAGL